MNTCFSSSDEGSSSDLWHPRRNLFRFNHTHPSPTPSPHPSGTHREKRLCFEVEPRLRLCIRRINSNLTRRCCVFYLVPFPNLSSSASITPRHAIAPFPLSYLSYKRKMGIAGHLHQIASRFICSDVMRRPG